MIDTIIYQALTQPNLAGLLQNADGTWRIYPNGTLGSGSIPAKPEWPYLQHGGQGDNRVVSVRDIRKTYKMYWDLFVYDEPTSFLRIKTIIDLATDNLEGMVGQVTPDGWRATQIQHTNSGGDGYDPVNQQNTKRATLLVVTSRAA